MNVPRRATLLLAPWLVLLAACTSIPLGTLWELRDFGADDLATIDPQGVRVAALIEPGPRPLDPARSALTLTLTPKQGPPEQHVFSLRNARIYSPQLVPAGDRRWQVLELDDDARVRVRRLLPVLRTVKEHYTGAELNVTFETEDDLPADVDELRMSIRVQLAPEQEPLLLFDRAPLPVEHASGK